MLALGILAVLGPTLAACKQGAPEKPAAAPAPESADLLVLPGATDVQRRNQSGTTGVAYSVQAPFPAAEQIEQVLKSMTERGWVAQEEDLLNPGIPTSTVRGWMTYVDATHTPRRRRYVWSTEWRNARGDLASYAFSYVMPETGTEALRQLSVSAGVLPVEWARRVEEEGKRHGANPIETHGRLPDGAPEVMRTVHDASPGGCFLASNHLGDAIVQLTAFEGPLVAYRWRVRSADGTISSGAAPPSSTIQAGPLRLSWMPPFDGREPGRVGYYPQEMDLIPLPAGSFDVDLVAVRRLAALTPERDERFRRFVLPAEQASQGRTEALLLAGKTTPVRSGQAFVVEGPAGRGVVVIEDAGMRSIRYRWRYRAASAASDEGGTAESSDSPYPSIHVGPYAMFWQMTSQSSRREGNGPVVREWWAMVRYLAEEFAITAIPEGEAAELDLSKPVHGEP